MQPSLSDRNPVEELAEEFVERHRRGERPSVQEYAQLHPQWSEQIQKLFPTLLLMEQVRPGGPDDTSTRRAARIDGPPPGLERLGDYRILREVARGGMGVVYEATQESLGRHVALKVLAAQAIPDPRHLQRFQREAKAAARLHHSNIVPVHGVGEQDGLHYYVMQFIQGLGLDQVLGELRRLRNGGDPSPARNVPSASRRDLSVEVVTRAMLSGEFAPDDLDRAERSRHPASMATTVCGQVPTEENVRPVVRKPDLPAGNQGMEPAPGLGPETASSGVYLPGQAAGSSLSESGWPYWRSVARIGIQVADALSYARSQGVLHRDIKPSNLLLDTRGTVWVTDFGLAKAESDQENLTHTGDIVGTLRYMAPERFSGASDVRSDIYSLGLTLYELLTLRPAFDDADRGSLIRRVLQGDPPPPRKVDPTVPRDLETIVLKAVAREPDQRYQTPAEMAEDFQRFLDDQPIRARPLSYLARMGRWCRRNPTLAVALGIAAALLLVIAIGSPLAVLRIIAARDAAGQSAREAVSAERNASSEAEESRRLLLRMLVANGTQRLDEGDLLASIPWFVEALKRDRDDAAHAEMHRIRLGAVLRQAPKLAQMWFHENETYAEFSADGRRALTTSQNGMAQVWDVATGNPVTPLLTVGHRKKHWWFGCAALSRDGRFVVAGSGDENEGAAQVFNAETGAALTPPLPHAAAVRFAAFSSDSRFLLTVTGCSGREGMARVWNAATGEPVTPALEHKPEILCAAFSPDGRQFATGGLDGTVRVWNVAGGNPAFPLLRHRERVWSTQFSHDGRHLLSAAADDTAQIWDAATGAHRHTLKHEHWVRYAEFSPDDRFVVTASDDNTARVWNAATGVPVTPRLQHRQIVRRACFSSDGRRVVTASDDTTVRVWDAATGKELGAPLKHASWVKYASFSPDGRQVLTAGMDQTARLWDVGAGEMAVSRLVNDAKTQYVSPDGRFVVTIGDNSIVRVWDSVTGQAICPPIHHEQLTHLTIQADGSRLATSSPNGTARVWDTLTGAQVTPPLEHKAAVRFVFFSADGARLVTASEDRMVRVWNTRTGEPLTAPLPHVDVVHHAAFSPDGRRVATASRREDTAQVWDVETGARVMSPVGNLLEQSAVSFSPDGRRLLTYSHESAARVWDAFSGESVLPPLQHNDFLLSASFSRDGRRVVTSSADGTARVWDAATGKPVCPPILQSGLGGDLGWGTADVQPRCPFRRDEMRNVGPSVGSRHRPAGHSAAAARRLTRSVVQPRQPTPDHRRHRSDDPRLESGPHRLVAGRPGVAGAIAHIQTDR